ncbi:MULTISPECIES: hypothetical protein [Micromonospora]|uniref:DUF5709 domain-containing protein n=1 Tax=Micromonospora yangpuensis TaxID=683228 RepID=A0A1C6V6E1_9ACTN|nr:hypothetical protein [Micromonospora yangpuensis]GGM19222.1 hypothetical protein GCM10012279_41930 [Micromonospora yangpuensis]SCL61923.1 hypothetical protein GA0070617_4800 [Micromonospora yangpuensis]
MTDRDAGRDRPLEESPEVAAAVDDETTVAGLRTPGGGVDADTPRFAEPGEQVDAAPTTEDLLGDPYGAGTGAGGDNIRTGGEQPWEPTDLVAARGQDPTPENLERARRDLAEQGSAAVERTVP